MSFDSSGHAYSILKRVVSFLETSFVQNHREVDEFPLELRQTVQIRNCNMTRISCTNLEVSAAVLSPCNEQREKVDRFFSSCMITTSILDSSEWCEGFRTEELQKFRKSKISEMRNLSLFSAAHSESFSRHLTAPRGSVGDRKQHVWREQQHFWRIRTAAASAAGGRTLWRWRWIRGPAG